jgi:hypothetical protein
MVESIVKPDGIRRRLWDTAITKTNREERVHFIAELISTGRYRTSFIMAFAQAWGLTKNAVISITTEASRWVHFSAGDKDQIRANVGAFMESIAHVAKERGQFREAITAMRNYAEISGAYKQEITHVGHDGGPITINHEIKNLSNEQLDALLATEVAKAIAEGKIHSLPADVKMQLAAASNIPDAELVEDEVVEPTTFKDDIDKE